MATELWAWQDGTPETDHVNAVVMGSEGSSIAAGFTYGNWNGTNIDGPAWVALKLDAEGAVVWEWQDGTSLTWAAAIAMDLDGSIVIAGNGDGYHAAIKLDSEGVELWRWLEGFIGGSSRTEGATILEDGSVVAVGYIWDGEWATPSFGETDFIAYKLDANGTLLWRWQVGTPDFDTLSAVVAVDEDGSVVMAGQTSGDLSGISVGSNDFVAIKLDSEGTELWTWQDGTSSSDFIEAAAATGDGSVVLAGNTEGEWSGDLTGERSDFAAVKLDSEGIELWRWQAGYAVEYNGIHAVAVQQDGSVLLTGRTGNFNAIESIGVGSSDIAVVMLGADGEEMWRWKEADSADIFVLEAMAAGSDGRMIVAGHTNGSWGGDASRGGDDFLAVMFNTTALATLVTPTQSTPPAALPAAATTAPVPATAAPEGSGATGAPSPSPSFGITSTTSPVSAPPEQKSASDSTPIVAGVLSAVAGAALVALAVCQRRWRGSNQKITLTAVVPPSHEDGNAERGGEAPLEASAPPYSAVVAVGNGDEKPPPYQGDPSPREPTPAGIGTAGSEGIVPPPVSAALDGQMQPSAGHAENAAGGGGSARRASDGSAEKLSAVATIPTATLSTAERDEVSRFHQQELEAAPVSGGPGREEASSSGGPGSSSAADRQSPADIGLGRAVLAAAQELAHHCQIPGVSEAANAVLMVMNLVTDSRDNARASEVRVRQCSTVVLALKRAAKVADKGGDTIGAVAHGMIEDVHGAIFDLVQLIKTYQSKNKLSRVFLSTLFKRRQEELDAVVDQAIMRLQLGLQLQVGQDVGAVKDKVDCVKKGMDLYQLSLSEAASESVVEARRVKRQRKLDQVEIPAEYLSITDEVLGQGGFGEVYLADYNGHNAAAKVLHIAKTGTLDENQKQQESRQHRAFLRELEAMMRLRSLNTVNVYGAVTSLPDRMVLVMELLAGGDLLTLLRKSKKPLPERQSRRIIRDICTGMAFLHSKNTVHGDLKSANVLLDGDGRAKIADFGTSRWTQTTNSTGLATYTTKSSQTTQMSIAWSAPEVLDSEGSSYESDVYSFGIVVWEVLSRELPWSNKARPSEILTAVLRGVRPSFHVDAPADMVDIAKACWCGEPKERPTFRAILDGTKANGWGDE